MMRIRCVKSAGRTRLIAMASHNSDRLILARLAALLTFLDLRREGHVAVRRCPCETWPSYRVIVLGLLSMQAT